jgi:hypothetical protein
MAKLFPSPSQAQIVLPGNCLNDALRLGRRSHDPTFRAAVLCFITSPQLDSEPIRVYFSLSFKLGPVHKAFHEWPRHPPSGFHGMLTLFGVTFISNQSLAYVLI